MSKYKNLSWRVSDLLEDLKNIPRIISKEQLSTRAMDRANESGVVAYHGYWLVSTPRGYALKKELFKQEDLARYDRKGKILN